MEEDPSQLIKTWRRHLRMTQEEFAREIAVTVSTVNRWENGHAVPSKLAWRVVHEFAKRRGLIGNPFQKSGREDQPKESSGVGPNVDESVPPGLPGRSALAAASC